KSATSQPSLLSTCNCCTRNFRLVAGAFFAAALGAGAAAATVRVRCPASIKARQVRTRDLIRARGRNARGRVMGPSARDRTDFGNDIDRGISGFILIIQLNIRTWKPARL